MGDEKAQTAAALGGSGQADGRSSACAGEKHAEMENRLPISGESALSIVDPHGIPAAAARSTCGTSGDCLWPTPLAPLTVEWGAEPQTLPS